MIYASERREVKNRYNNVQQLLAQETEKCEFKCSDFIKNGLGEEGGGGE